MHSLNAFRRRCCSATQNLATSVPDVKPSAVTYDSSFYKVVKRPVLHALAQR